MLILKTYKLNLLISLTVAVIILALRVEKEILPILAIISGSLLGGLLLEVEYFIIAYFSDPDLEFSKNVVQFATQKNYFGLFTYINANKVSLEKRLINSFLFQFILGLLALYAVTSSGDNLFALALSLSVFVSSFYHMYEEYELKRSLAGWFWIFKTPPAKQVQNLYILAMGLFLVYILSQIS